MDEKLVMDKTITIQEKAVLGVFRNASSEQKNALICLFGKEIFLKNDVTERIKTFEDACNELGYDNELVSEYESLINDEKVYPDEFIASIKLRIITEALNEGWEPTYDKNERRWYPLFFMFKKEEYDGLSKDEKKKFLAASFKHGKNGIFVCSCVSCASSNQYCIHSFKFSFKTGRLAEYCGKQFIDIWSVYLLP